MASLISSPFETSKFSSPKRARLSLRHRLGHSPFKPQFDVVNSTQDIASTEEKMLIDDSNQDQDENISPNSNILETKFSPYISDDIVRRNYKTFALGLPNCGNTCYLNSILQVLRYTPNFCDTLRLLVSSQNELTSMCSDPSEVKPDDFFHKLHMLYIAMKKQELLHKVQENYKPALDDLLESFILSLGEISSLFKEGEQSDAHEFLLTVLSHFDTVSLKVKQTAETYCNNSMVLTKSNASPPKEKRKQPIKSDKYQSQSTFNDSSFLQKISNYDLGFEGNMQHTIRCLECERRSDRIESFTNLEVSIAKDCISEETVDLCQCLIQRTTLSGDNKYFCQECFHSTEAQLSSEVITLPSVLVLHCNGLRQSSFESEIEKDSTKIVIPLHIKTSENLSIFQTATDETYCLYAVVLHIGTSIENGHYVSFIKDTSEKSDYLMLKSNKQNCATIRHCCALNAKTNSSMNNWLFFDDEEVLPLSLSDSSVFPYYEFMTTTASPSIIFYYKK